MLLISFICILAGLITGFLSGFFGIGGGFVLVPILVQLIPYTSSGPIDNIMHIATTTSLAAILLSSLRAIYIHAKKKNIDFKELYKYAIWVISGTIIGKYLLQFLDSFTLKIIFVCFLYIIVIRFIVKVVLQNKGETKERPVNPLFRVLMGLFTGAFSIFVGVGGGVPSTFLYSHYRPLRFAIGMGAATTILVSFSSTIQSILYALLEHRSTTFTNFGGINLPLALCILPSIVLTIPLGIHTMHKVSSKVLNIVYLLFMIVLATFSTLTLF